MCLFGSGVPQTYDKASNEGFTSKVVWLIEHRRGSLLLIEGCKLRILRDLDVWSFSW